MSSSAYQLPREAYFSPMGVVARDRTGRIEAVNLAFELVFKGEVGSWRLDEQLRGRLDAFLPARVPGEAFCAVSSSWTSPSFGACELVASEVPRYDPATGEERGSVVFLELCSIEKETEFRRSLRWEIQRQLAWELYSISYDRILLTQDYYREVVDRHERAMTAPGVATVLDIGAGTGNVAIRLLAAGRRVTAVDLSRSMLSRLRAKTADVGADRLEIVEASAENLDFLPSERFDGVNVLLAFFDMTQPRRAVEEAIRLLRPGGHLVITEPKRGFDMATVLEGARRHLVAIGKWEELESDFEKVHGVNRLLDPAERQAERDSERRLFSEDLLELLRTRGFQELAQRNSHFGECATLTGRKAP